MRQNQEAGVSRLPAGGWSANLTLGLLHVIDRGLGNYPETGFEEINCDLPQADFWGTSPQHSLVLSVTRSPANRTTVRLAHTR